MTSREMVQDSATRNQRTLADAVVAIQIVSGS